MRVRYYSPQVSTIPHSHLLPSTRLNGIQLEVMSAAPARPLWERIERIRRDRGWTKVRLAREIGIDRTTFNKWQTQPRPPQASSVRQVAKRLDIDQAEALQLAGFTDPAAIEPTSTTPYGETPRTVMDEVNERLKDDPELAQAVLQLIRSAARAGDNRSTEAGQPETGDRLVLGEDSQPG